MRGNLSRHRLRSLLAFKKRRYDSKIRGDWYIESNPFLAGFAEVLGEVWDEPTIRHNVLNRYSADQVHGTDFDSNSVMLYAFPDEWTLNMGATHENEDLSQLDRDFVRSERMYPGRDTGDTIDDRAIELTVARGVEGEISEAHEEDIYRFAVIDTATHLIETAGSTDVIMSLFGPNSPTQLVATDDDGGIGRNARISAALQPGIYYAVVRHFNPTRTGEYRITVSAF